MTSHYLPGFSATDSPYRAFRECRSGVNDETPHEIPMTTIVDKDGSILFETEFGALLQTIVRQNDVAALEQYLAKAPLAIGSGEEPPKYDDVFSIAAQSGSVDVLRILLERYSVSTTQTTLLQKRGLLLLHVASDCGQPQVVQFLLDNYPAYADIHVRDESGYTAIGSAASLDGSGHFDFVWERESPDRSEQVMDLLLDRGASASDVVLRPRSWGERPEIICDTVLTLAARWARPQLIQRLIDGGADAQAKTSHADFSWEDNTENDIGDATAVFTSSLFANVDAIKVLLDCRGPGIDISDMVSCRDSQGRLPLHWAARKLIPDEIRRIPASKLRENAQRIMGTLELLLEANPSTINIQDNKGNTPLHYAAQHYGQLGKEHNEIFKFLCDRGADASLRNKKRETPLHSLCCRTSGGLPIDVAAITILLEHSAKTTDADRDGNTPLHQMVSTLHNLEAAEFLVSHDADVSAKN
ncbi:ankyrin repeat-containing domain protein [Thelonectria olida]|uniref:Ankyrin repeat-containing domain protein n=1 Tax=Thelonectria olida TaxID=1576542 RepID=A0A9P8VXV8_9HYPO|nr:ankyrin repeat-containing domain protein [Thelonectria olida]